MIAGIGNSPRHRGAQVAAALRGRRTQLVHFLQFKGGRVSYVSGVMALCPPAALIGGEVLFVSAGITRYASFGSILGVIATYVILVPLTLIYQFPLEYLFYALIGGIVIIVMHRDNIIRLITGTERKLGQKADKIDRPSSTDTGYVSAPKSLSLYDSWGITLGSSSARRFKMGSCPDYKEASN